MTMSFCLFICRLKHILMAAGAYHVGLSGLTDLLFVDGLQHKGAMSTKPVFEKVAKIQRLYLCAFDTDMYCDCY